MFEILGIQIWETISYGIVKSLYGTVMRVYEVLYDLAENDLVWNFASFASSLYIVAGLFMLFRLTIGMIQMIIDPDRVNDKQVGTGKLISRIFVVIVLLLAFNPDGFIIGQGGIMDRVQSALLAQDGFISNISKVAINSSTDDDSSNNSSSSVSYDDLAIADDYSIKTITEERNSYVFLMNNLFYDNVYALRNSDGSTTCWFHPGITKHGNGKNSRYDIADGYRITFSSTKFSDSVCNSENTKCIKVKRGDSKKLYAKIDTYAGEEYLDSEGKSHRMTYSSLKSIEQSKRFLTSWSDTANNVKKCSNWYLYFSPSNQATLIHDDGNLSIQDNYMRGISSYESYVKAIKVDLGTVHEDADVDGNDAASAIADDTKKEGNEVSYSDQAIDFGTSLVSCFQECTSSDSQVVEDCEKAKRNQFNNTNSDDIVDLMDKEDLTLSFIMAVIAGIVVMVFLVILIVDIIVRGLKMAFLELIAPIPIISYVDPNDKIFVQWLKIYIATYLSLFIKLISISIAIMFLQAVNSSGIFDGNIFVKFLVIIAIIIFAKLLPDMVTKIFGLDSMGGSMKEIGGMLKAGVGFGAGAVLGAAAGAATGKGFGMLSGFAKGAIMGAGSGAKGNITGGAQGISARNAKINQQKADGLNFWQRAAVAVGGMTGITPGAKAANQMEKANQAYEAQSKFKNHMLDEVKKKNANFNVGAINKGQNIIRKGGDSSNPADVVARTGENIDMKNEYAKQANLSNLSQDQWFRMSDQDKVTAFGEAAFNADGSARSLTEAQIFQNNRVAALEDYAIAQKASDLSNDAETVKEYNAFKDAVTQAQKSGVEMSDLPELNKFNNKTVSNAKDQALQGYNKAASSSSVKIQKHIDSK